MIASLVSLEAMIRYIPQYMEFSGDLRREVQGQTEYNVSVKGGASTISKAKWLC